MLVKGGPAINTLNTEVWKKHNRHFADGILKCIFLEKNFLHFNMNVQKFVSEDLTESIASGDGLALNRWQAITRTKGNKWWEVINLHLMHPWNEKCVGGSNTALTHLSLDKMSVISHTTFSNAFSWINIWEFRLKFHCCLFPRIQLTIFQHWFR